MRIIVPVKQVPETNAVTMDEATGTMIREGVEAIVNPLDLYAIEIAIRLREAHGGEVVAVSMGPPKAVQAVKEAVAMGCDSGVLVSDKAFAGSDTWATSYVLAEAIRAIGRGTFASGVGESTGGKDAEAGDALAVVDLPAGRQVQADAASGDRSQHDAKKASVSRSETLGEYQLVICGERATDGDTGQVGPGIAAWLDLPVATYVSKVESVAPGSCRCHRLVEEGYEVLDVATPAVLTVVKEIADPRLPTLRGKQKARRLDVPTLGPDELDVKEEFLGLAGSPTRVVKIFRPKVARQCRKVVANDEAAIDRAADELVAFLRQKELI